MEPRKGSGAGMVVALIGAVVIPLVVILVMMSRPDPQTYRFSIAPGTAAAVARGEAVANPLPVELNLKVGDSIEVTNNDVAVHTYTFLLLKPGEVGRYTFRNAGNFTTECTVGEHTSVRINVAP